MNNPSETTTTNNPEAKIAAEATTIGTLTASPQKAENTIDRITRQFREPKPESETPTEAAPPTETTTATVPADDTPPEIKSDKARANWKELRSKAKERDELETKWKSAVEELTKMKSAPRSSDPDPEIERIKKEHQEYSEILQKKHLEEYPKFKAHYEKAKNELIDQAKRLVGSENATALAEMLKLPDGQYRQDKLNEMVEALPTFQQHLVTGLFRDLDKVNAERDSQLANYREGLAQIHKHETAEREKTQAQQKAEIESALSSTLAAAKDLEAFKSRDGDDAHNQAIATREALIKGYFGGALTKAQYYAMPLLAAEGMFLKESELPALRGKVEELTKQLEAIKASKPGLDGGESRTASAMPENTSAVNRILIQAKSSGAVK